MFTSTMNSYFSTFYVLQYTTPKLMFHQTSISQHKHVGLHSCEIH
jgi:hypothetical protein